MRYEVLEMFRTTLDVDHTLFSGDELLKKDWNGKCYVVHQYGKIKHFYPTFRVEEMDDYGKPLLSAVLYFEIRNEDV
jgi:hypothetical protein